MKRDDHFCRNGRLVRFCNGYFIRLGSYFISNLLSENSKVVSFLIPITAFNLVKNHSTTRPPRAGCMLYTRVYFFGRIANSPFQIKQNISA